jgi:hypothetical protein
MPGPMTPSPQQLSPPAAGRTNPFGGGDPDGVSHADRLWIALALARAGGTPSTRAHIEDAVFRFYLPMARALAVVPRDVGDTPEGRIDRLREGLLVRCEATKQTRPHQGDPRGPP